MEPMTDGGHPFLSESYGSSAYGEPSSIACTKCLVAIINWSQSGQRMGGRQHSEGCGGDTVQDDTHTNNIRLYPHA